MRMRGETIPPLCWISRIWKRIPGTTTKFDHKLGKRIHYVSLLGRDVKIFTKKG